MRLVLARAASARALLASGALLAAVTTALLTAFLQYAQLLPTAGARAIVGAAPPIDRALVATGASGSTATEVSARDAALRAVFARGLGGTPTEIAAAGYASGQRMPDGFGGTVPDADGTYAVVAFLDGLPDHADLVSGAWPAPAPAGRPTQVALPEPVAAALGLRVGDRIPVTDERVRRAAPLAVAALFRPRDAAESYWELAAGPVRTGGYGPMVVHRDEFLARYVAQSTLDWVVTPRLSGVDVDGLAAMGAHAAYVTAERPEVLGIDGSIRIRTGLDDLSAELGTAALVTRSGLLLPVLLFAVIAGYGLLLVARLLADQRRGENELLRARGAGRGQLVWLAGTEALLVVAPALLLAPPLAARGLAWFDRWSTARGLPLLVGDARPGTAWVIAAAAALGCAVALVAPAARRRGTWVAELQARSRPARLAWAARAGVDLALVGVAVLAATQLRRYAGTLTGTAATGDGGLGIDPLLVTAPTLGVLAATAVSLRLLPAVTRMAVRTGNDGSFARLLGLWQADRRPHAGPVLLLVLAVAGGALAVCVAGTWQRSQRDQANHRVGAELRISLPETRSTAPPAGMDGVGLPGAAATMAVYRGQLSPGEGRPVTMLAVDATAAGAVVRMRPDLADEPPDALFGRLQAQRRPVPGVTLPAGAVRLTGEVRVRVSPRPAPISFDPIVAHVVDAAGIVRAVPLGSIEDGRLAFDAPLPPGTQRLVGLSAGARIVFAFGFYDPFDATVEWRWAGLGTIDGGGARAPFDLPATWTADADQEAGTDTNGTGAVVRTRLTGIFPGTGWQFRLADAGVRPEPVPALVTPPVLAAAGGQVGETVSFDSAFGGTGVDVRVVGLLDSVPSTPDGAGVVVDLPALSGYRFAARQPPVWPTEWWLATTPDGHGAAAAAAAERGLVVLDRRAEVRRLLDDPLGSGVLVALYATALAGTVLAAFGLAVDARATALRRSGEMAVLHTLGASPGSLARAFVVEQSVLAGLGVAAGAAVGLAIAWLLAPSLVPTSSGTHPVPEALLSVPAPVALPAAVLFVAALALGAAVARRARRDVVAGLLRIGEDR